MNDLWQTLADLGNKLSMRRISYMLTIGVVKAFFPIGLRGFP
jgi:hypothetical protein